MLSFDETMLDNLVAFFSFSDIPKIEQRFSEICYSSDPLVLLEKDAKGDYIEFRCTNNDLARIYFLIDPDSGTINSVSDIIRDGSFSEAPLNWEELKKAIREISDNEMKDSYDKLIDDYQKNASEIRKYQSLLSGLNRDYQKLRDEKIKAEDELSDLREQQNLLQKNNTSLNNDIKKKEKECDKLSRELSSLKMKASENTDRISRLEAQYSTALSDLETQRKMKDKVTQTLRTIETQLKNKETEAANLKQALSQTPDAFEEYKTQTEEKITQNRETITQLHQICQETREKNDTLESSLHTLKGLEKQTRQKLSEMEKTIASLQKNQKTSNDLKLAKQLKAKQEEYDQLQSTYKKLLKNKEKADKQYHSAQTERTQLQERISQYEEENKQLHITLEDAQTSNRQIREEHDLLTHKLEELQKSYHTISRDNTCRFYSKSQCRNEFKSSFYHAQKTLLIISPWINQYIYDDIRNDIRHALARGVSITIGYGIEEEKNMREYYNKLNANEYLSTEEKRNAVTYKLARQLQNEFSTMKDFCIFNANSHEKILSYDHKITLVGSFNFLTYSGIGTREESAVCVPGEAFANEVYAKFNSKIKAVS